MLKSKVKLAKWVVFAFNMDYDSNSCCGFLNHRQIGPVATGSLIRPLAST